MGGGHHLIECRTLRLGAADPVAILVDDFKPSLLRQPPPSRACVSGFQSQVRPAIRDRLTVLV